MFKTKSQKNELSADQEFLENSKNLLLEEFDHPGEIAAFYGFTPIKPLQVTKEDREKASDFFEISQNRASDKNKKSKKITQNKKGSSELNAFLFSPEEKASICRIYKDHGMEKVPHPVMLYFKKSQIKTPEVSGYRSGLAMMGSESGMAEILMIKTVLAILSEHGIKNPQVEINSTGDKDSVIRFEKELSAYLRKNQDSIPEEWREQFKDDVWKILRCKDENCKEFIENAPQPISFLTPPGIQHFKEILEYLEILEIPYKINKCLVGHKNCCPQTIFEVRETEKTESDEDRGKLLAVGHRHNYFSKKMGLKRNVPTIVTDLIFEKTPKKQKTGKRYKPKFYFIQIGPQAKIKSLNIIEELRKAKIRISHSLTEDKLTNQMKEAEKLKVSYLVIMGHRESMDDTVIVRDMETRFQETVSKERLSKYLKSLKTSRS